MGGLIFHCYSSLPASEEGSRACLPGHLTPLLRLPPSPDLTAAQPRAVSVLWSRVLASPLALFLSVSRECPPATFASLALNVPGAGAPCPTAPGRRRAPPSLSGCSQAPGVSWPNWAQARGAGRPELRERGPKLQTVARGFGVHIRVELRGRQIWAPAEPKFEARGVGAAEEKLETTASGGRARSTAGGGSRSLF